LNGKEKTKILSGHGSMNTSNVNSNSECITLTYTVKNIRLQKDILNIEKELEELVDEDIIFDLEIKGHTSPEPEFVLKAKVKTCNNEERGHEIKEIFDKFLKKKGGQTTLDEVEEN
jgi:hypothetical protein